MQKLGVFFKENFNLILLNFILIIECLIFNIPIKNIVCIEVVFIITRLLLKREFHYFNGLKCLLNSLSLMTLLNLLSPHGLITTCLLAVLFAIITSGYANIHDGLLYKDIRAFLGDPNNRKKEEFKHIIIDLNNHPDKDLLRIFQLIYIFGKKHSEICGVLFLTSTVLDYKKREMLSACITSLNNYNKFVNHKIKR